MAIIFSVFVGYFSETLEMRPARGGYTGGQGAAAPMKNVASVAPHFGPASLDFHLNRPVISLIQLHIVPPVPPAGIVAPHWPHLASARTAPEASAIAICSPISAFQWSQNAWPWMTLTGYFALNYVFAPLCLAESVRPSKNNCANTNRHTTKWQKSSTRTLVYGNVKFTPIFAGVL